MSESRLPPALPFEAAIDALRALAEPTRLRILAILSERELTVTDLTDILGQSQPRISRHLKLLLDAGVIERAREGAFAFFRLGEARPERALVRALLGAIDLNDPVLARDRERLSAVRKARAEAASAYFRAHAGEWDRMRALHVDEDEVERAILAAVGDGPIRALLDLGTGTGRMLELLGPRAERALGIDQSPDMLALARATLDRPGLRHCQVRQGDIYAPPVERASHDLVIIHQVLHFLDDPARALAEAGRALAPGGRLIVVDFAPHGLDDLRRVHHHRRLGFDHDSLRQWFSAAGLETLAIRDLAPPAEAGDRLTVSIWLARDPRLRTDAPLPDFARRNVA